ncbi:hypothetical protein E2542_SST06773 [Spatholobus suberectus]|nr:hypothetical protein E2542_SST06773 [Spatholobus suberectus]
MASNMNSFIYESVHPIYDSITKRKGVEYCVTGCTLEGNSLQRMTMRTLHIGFYLINLKENCITDPDDCFDVVVSQGNF